MRHLDGIPPDAGIFQISVLSGSVRAEVDPLAVLREAGDVVVGRMRSETTRLAARSGDHIDLELALKIGVERNPLAIGRPAGGARDRSAHRGELNGVGPVGIGQPDFPFARAIGSKGDPAAVRGKLGALSNRVEEMATAGGDEAGAPARRGLDTPNIRVNEAANIDQPWRPAGLGPRDRRHRPVLAHERESRRRGFAGDGQPPKTSPGGKENFFAVGHPRRVG